MIKTGTVVSSTYASGAFRRVTYGKTGYVASKYLTLYEKKQTVSGQRYLVLKKTPIKKTAVDTATTIGTLNEEDVYYTSQHVTNPLGETWYQISKEGKTGFVLANQATPIAYESQSNLSLKTTAATTIRSYAGPSYATVQTIPSNTVIKISGRIGNWYRVSYNGKTGYAASSTFTTLATKQKIAGARFELEKAVSIKSSPDAKASTLTTLQSGDIYYTTQLVTSKRSAMASCEQGWKDWLHSCRSREERSLSIGPDRHADDDFDASTFICWKHLRDRQNDSFWYKHHGHWNDR